MNELSIKSSVTLSEEASELIRQLQVEYDAADRLCKEVEEFRDQAGIPAINEMRYAGYHLLSFTSAANQDEDLDQLRKAISHCQRAAYEACEAGILCALELIDLFREDYESVTVSDVIPDWVGILRRCDELKDEISENREKGDDKSSDHIAYTAAFRELRDFQRTTKYAREDLNKKILAQQKTARNTLIGTLVACMGIVVAIVIGIASA